MSRLIYLLLLLIGASAMFTACTKNADSSTPVNAMNAVLTGNSQWVPGGTWTSTSATALTTMGNFTPAGYTKELFIAATQTSGTAIHGAIVLTIGDYQDSAKVFTIDNVNNFAEYLSLNPDTVLHTAIYGTVSVTKGNDQTATGYFTFTCSDSTKVTNGVYNVKIQAH